MGGRIVPKIYSKLAAVIARADFDSNTQASEIREAFMHRIQVIPEEFLDEVIDNDAIELIVKKSLCSWGRDVRLY